MRILTRRIYRAFPELDHYSDEQCERFLAAARRRGLRRQARQAAWVLFFCVVVCPAAQFALVGAMMLFERFIPATRYNDGLMIVGVLVATIPAGAFAGGLMLLVRDLLLRRRVRYVLRTRGTCHGCRYSLVGLPVDGNNFVTCPECGTESQVDPSMGELVVDQTGRARYQPSAGSLPRPPRVFTPERLHKLRRIGVVAAFILGIGLPAAWGGYELWLRRQADQAASERPGPEGIMAFVEKCQPPGLEAGAPNAWDAFHRAQLLLETADARLWRTPTSKYVPYFDAIYSNRKPNDDPAQAASDEACKDLALKCIEAYRADGVLDELGKVAACRRAVCDVSFSTSQPAIAALLPELGQTRNLARINAARMKLAADKHDLKEFTEATEQTLALARICRQQPFLIDSLVGIAIESLVYNRLRAVLATHPDASWLDAIDGAIARQSFTPPRAQFFEGERLSILDTTAWVFSNPSMVRRGQFAPSSMSTSMFGGAAKGTLGTYGANRDEFNDRFATMSAYVDKDPWERSGLGQNINAPSNLLMVNLLMPAMSKAVQSLDQVEMERRGYAVMSALERYHLAHGAYPRVVTELVPEVLKQLPLDPWSGRPFGYVRLAAPDGQGREYLLYSTGADGVDNGGLAAPGEGVHYNVLSRETGPYVGFDFIINDNKR